MYPTLFTIGDFKVSTYSVCIIVGLIGAILLYKFLSKKFGISAKAYDFYSFIIIIAIIIGFLFAALFQSLYNAIAGEGWTFGAVTFMGGLIGGVAAFAIITWIFAKPDVKKEFWKTANVMAPCLVGAHSFGRIGCVFAGCCYGKPTDSWIGMVFPYGASGSTKVIPTNLIEAIFLAVLCAVMLVVLLGYKKDKPQMLIYLYSYAVFRFILEFWRDDHRGGLENFISPSQFQSIVMMIVAILLTLWIFLCHREPFDGRGFGKLILAPGERGVYLRPENAAIYDPAVAAETVADTQPETLTDTVPETADESISETEQESYSVVLRDAGEDKVSVIKLVRENTDLDLIKAKELIEETPAVVKKRLTKTEAEELAAALEGAGATVEIR